MFCRRDYQRFICNNSVSLLAKEGIEKRFLLKDLSTRGAGIVGSYSLDINERVKVIINAPLFFDKAVSRHAKVAWCQKLDENSWQGGLDFGEDNKITFL